MPLPFVLLLIVLTHTSFKGSKVLVTLFAIELGASEFIVGFLFAMYSLFPAFLSIYAGQISDRLGFRPPMLLGAVGLLAGLLIPYYFPSLLGLLCSVTLIGLCYIFYIVSIQHLVGTIGSEADRTRNYSYYSIAVGVTALSGPTLAGFAIEHLGHRHTFTLLALFPFLPIVVLLLVRSAKAGRESPSDKGPKEERRFGDLWRSPPLRRVMVTAGILETGNELVNFLLPIYGHSVGLSPSEIGLVMGAYGAALLVMRALMPALVRRSSEELVLSYSMTVACTACVIFPFVGTFAPMLLVAFLMGAGLGCGAPLSMVLTYNRAPPGRSGEAMGLRQVVNKSTEVMVPMVFGSVSTAFGMWPVFWVDGLLLGFGSWLMRKEARFRDAQRLEATPDAQNETKRTQART